MVVDIRDLVQQSELSYCTQSFCFLDNIFKLFNMIYYNNKQITKTRIMHNCIRLLVDYYDKHAVRDKIEFNLYNRLRWNTYSVVKLMDTTSVNQTNDNDINRTQTKDTKTIAYNKAGLLPSDSAIYKRKKDIGLCAAIELRLELHDPTSTFDYNVVIIIEEISKKSSIHKIYAVDGVFTWNLGTSWDGTQYGKNNCFYGVLKLQSIYHNSHCVQEHPIRFKFR